MKPWGSRPNSSSPATVLTGAGACRRQDLIFALPQVATQTRRAAMEVIFNHLIIQVGARRASHHLELEIAAGLGGGELANLRTVQGLITGVRADQHAAIGQRMELGASRRLDSHCEARPVLEGLPVGANQWPALAQRSTQQVLGVLRLQGAQHLSARVHAKQHCAAIAVGKRAQRLSQRISGGLRHDLQLTLRRDGEATQNMVSFRLHPAGI
jgi:hypothetical protein